MPLVGPMLAMVLIPSFSIAVMQACALIGQGLVALGDPVEVAPDVADADAVFDPAGDWTIPDELACSA